MNKQLENILKKYAEENNHSISYWSSHCCKVTSFYDVYTTYLGDGNSRTMWMKMWMYNGEFTVKLFILDSKSEIDDVEITNIDIEQDDINTVKNLYINGEV